MELRERERGSQTSAHYNRTQEDGKYSRVKLRQREDSQNGFTRVRAVANRLYRGTPLSPFESRLHLLRSTTEWRWGNWRGGSVGERVQSIGSKSGAKDRLRTWRVKGKLGEFSRFFFVFPSLSIIFLSLVFFFFVFCFRSFQSRLFLSSFVPCVSIIRSCSWFVNPWVWSLSLLSRLKWSRREAHSTSIAHQHHRDKQKAT